MPLLQMELRRDSVPLHDTCKGSTDLIYPITKLLNYQIVLAARF
jgi:hypothetical protein